MFAHFGLLMNGDAGQAQPAVLALTGAVVVATAGAATKHRLDTRTIKRRFWLNFILLVAFFTIAGLWFLHRTDYFEVFASVITLSGVFGLFPFLTKLIPEPESKWVQRDFFS